MLYLSKAVREENKAAYDKIVQYKDEIESELGISLIWNRGESIKSSQIYYQQDGMNVNNKDDWPKMAEFHANWSKRFYDVLVPYLK